MAYKTLFVSATQNDLEILQWDVKSAFPNALLNERIYVEQPHGFQNHQYSNRVCLLKKALYDLKQSARQQAIYLAHLLVDLSFSPFISNQSICLNNTTGIIIISYIDDLFIYEPNIEDIKTLKIALSKKIEITNLSEIFYYLSIEIIKDKAKKSLCMS